MLRQIFRGGTPDRHYATEERAINEFRRTCAKIGVDDIAFTVQATVIEGEPRWYVQVYPTEAQIQDALRFAHRGIRSVRV